MAIRTKDEILSLVRDRLGEDMDDSAIAFLEDVTDTLTDFETRTQDSTNWEQKYRDNDKEWRQKYRDRFYNKGTEDDPEDEPDGGDNKSNAKPKTFADLFSVKE